MTDYSLSEDFKNFEERFVSAVEDMFPEAEVTRRHVHKNHQLLHGITVTLPGNNYGPTLYAEDLYKGYQHSDSFDSIMDMAKEVYNSKMPEMTVNIDDIPNLDAIKDKIYPTFMSIEGNEDLLKNVPYTERDGLATVYKIMLSQEANVTINNSLMNIYDIPVKELDNIAKQNIPAILKPDAKPIEQILREQLVGQYINNGSTSREDAEREANAFLGITPMDNPEDTYMWVITGKTASYGAAAILDEKLMDDLTAKVGEVYILPSSVHEVIVLPKSKVEDVNELKAMVREVNNTEVSPADRLSYDIFTYNSLTKEIERADKPIEKELTPYQKKVLEKAQTKSAPKREKVLSKGSDIN